MVKLSKRYQGGYPIMKEGYMVTIIGKQFEKAIIFKREKPTQEEVVSLINDNKGVKAFVTPTELTELSEQTVR